MPAHRAVTCDDGPISRAEDVTHPLEATGHLDNQFEHEPVPRRHRRSAWSVGAAWAGMPMVLTATVIGGQLAYFLGFWRGVLALAVGASVLAVYVACLSYAAGRTGRNFGQFATAVFGRAGGRVPTLVLSTVLVGWYALQAGLTGALLSSLTGWSAAPIALGAGALFTLITFVGMRAISWIGYVSAPAFVIFAAIALLRGTKHHGWQPITHYAGVSAARGALSLGAGVTIVIASLVDAGTMTADFTRFSRTGRQAVLATLAAFPVGQFVSAYVGVLVVSAGLAVAPRANGGMFIGLLASGGSTWKVVVAVFVVLNLGAVCAHCLYNGAMGWSQATGAPFRAFTGMLGVIGLTAAAIGIWSQFSNWLNILGVTVPPIGVVVIVTLFARGYGFLGDDAPQIRWGAFGAWAAASAVALVIHIVAPALSDALIGILAAAITSLVAIRVSAGSHGTLSESSAPG